MVRSKDIRDFRLSKRRLYVCFVDVKRAFPSVRREILLQKLSTHGASDSLVRIIWSIYNGAKATVRGENGYSELFEILLGTRGGGSEASLLFVLFIADLIEHLEKVALSSDPVKLAGKLIRALLLADDLAIVAHSAADLQSLLDAWAAYCDLHNIQTQVVKTAR